MQIEQLGLKKVIVTELKGANVHSVRDLTERTESAVRRIPGIGDKRLADIKAALAARGLSLAEPRI